MKPFSSLNGVQALTEIKDYYDEESIQLESKKTGIYRQATLRAKPATVNIWPSTGHYQIVRTSYMLLGARGPKRSGEEGEITGNLTMLLDHLFFASGNL